MTSWVTYETAWEAALYGSGGFYRRREGPAGHFRTAAHAAPLQLAEAIARLAAEHGCTAVVDVGAGRGELLTGLTGTHLALHGVDVVQRPPDLPDVIAWSAGTREIPDTAFHDALVIGWELLDVVPCAVLELDGDGVPRQVEVEPATGRERLGDPLTADQAGWQARWWPVEGLDEGDRIEVGSTRDVLWADLNRRAREHGARLTLAVDYAHTRENRPIAGSLTGFRTGRALPPRPDGSMDVTAHVAIDAVAATLQQPALTTQREALGELGVTDRELLDPGALGGFAWLTNMFS